MRTYCGGCHDEGAHWRWCPEFVGPRAAIIGQAADQAEDLGDRLGSNYPEGANSLYAASGLLRVEARKSAAKWKEDKSDG